MSALPDFTALQQLLSESDEMAAVSASRRSVQEPAKPVEHSTVVKVGAAANASSSSRADSAASKTSSKDIWAQDEIKVAAEALAVPDGRARPSFDFSFAQRVGTADVFLGLQGTTPSSIHCDTMVLKITLPGERFADIDLDITNDRVALSASRQYVEGAARASLTRIGSALHHHAIIRVNAHAYG